MSNLLYKEEFFLLNGDLMDVHRTLGPGFLEIVYKDAVEFEFYKRNIDFNRERGYSIDYKSTTLKHQFYADFVVMDKIILEVKSQDGLPEVFSAQLLNYLRVSGNRLGVIANFYGTSLQTKRIVL